MRAFNNQFADTVTPMMTIHKGRPQRGEEGGVGRKADKVLELIKGEEVA